MVSKEKINSSKGCRRKCVKRMHTRKAKLFPRRKRRSDDDSDSDEDTSGSELVERVNNRLYFYADVNTKTALKFNRLLYEASLEIQKRAPEQESTPSPLYVFINSYGGELHAGLSMMDSIRTCPVPVVTVADGFCASAATFILMGGKERKMYKHAYIKIHQISTGFWGKFNDMLDEVQNSQEVMRMIKDVYLSDTKMTRREIESLVNKELCLGASECLQKRIVHEIM